MREGRQTQDADNNADANSKHNSNRTNGFTLMNCLLRARDSDTDKRMSDKQVRDEAVTFLGKLYVCFVLCTVCCVLCALCFVLRAWCFEFRASCFVLRALCFVLCALCETLTSLINRCWTRNNCQRSDMDSGSRRSDQLPLSTNVRVYLFW